MAVRAERENEAHGCQFSAYDTWEIGNSNLGHHTGQANAVRGINADQIRLASCTQSCFPVAQSDGKERKEKAHISNIFNCLHLRRAHTLGDKPKKAPSQNKMVPSKSDNGGKEI
ncbi:hypothetical protein TNCV_4724451 [Trichonephila clavipes]|uniref:Uncharacterized protein n=1 Tax=Trichonephila clavipes TaxID=2585209 RepID=A0A8X6W6Q0_TRICX|nr:hypothetical protein TNCV_4724451 [Trichonephila clavipes]